MAAQEYDLAIAGGGLAGGLIALALHKLRPEINIVLIEHGDHFGGNHIWSFFDSDIAPEHRWLIEPLISRHWDGYDVRFPKYSRKLDTGYCSIKSEDFDRVTRDTLPQSALKSGYRIACADVGFIDFENGESINPKVVLDTCGGDAHSFSALKFGWQKFCGQTLHLKQPHGLERPIIMDAAVEQIDGYRFVYCLPFSDTEVFVEDTYYSDTPDLDEAACRQRIAQYAASQGWNIERTSRNERGQLPVIYGGNFRKFWESYQWVEARAGARAALIHPVTSYSLPVAVRTAMMIAAMPEITQDTLDRILRKYALKHWQNGRYYRMLSAMMFKAARPDARYRVLEHTYIKDEKLIERFYAGKTTKRDKAALLWGKPPVPITKALAAMMKYR